MRDHSRNDKPIKNLMRVFLQALGCRLNEAELERWSSDCRARGFQLTTDAARADLMVLNTCAVTVESVRKSRQMIRRAYQTNPQAKLVVSGCHATLSPEQTAAELGVDLVVSNAEKDDLIDIAARELALPLMPQSATDPDENALFTRGRQRAFIKVQDGCRYRCAFCIVTQARGGERSRKPDDIIKEIQQLQAGGIQEVVLAGVHLGGYGSDLGTSLAKLVETVLQQTSIERIRLGSLEPWELNPDFWSLFSEPRLMPHLHLPIQSGADSVLRRMSRRCRTAEYRDLTAQARTTVPGFNVTTDIIVGFPGETEDEWQQTLAFTEQMAFGHIHIFAYSPRRGTKAADMPDQLSREVKRERSKQLHEIAQGQRRQILNHALKDDYAVLIESSNQVPATGRQTWTGYTPNYLRMDIETAAGNDWQNRIVQARAISVSDDGERLLGELVPNG